MSKIFVVGNIIKDVYLRLDERNEKLEKDEENNKWLNLAFDGSSHKVFERVGVFGGAAVTLEVLENLEVETIFQKTTRDVENYRYILCVNDEISYFIPTHRKVTKFIEPNEKVDWIFVDRSATINEKTAEEIVEFKNKNEIKLAFYVPKKVTRADKILFENADFIFLENEVEKINTNAKICRIGKDFISLEDKKVELNVSHEDMMTHLTINSIIAASILGTKVKDFSTFDSLLFAKKNVENATLNGTMEKEKIMELVEEEKTQNINLKLIAKSLVGNGKGILAADESGGSIHKKFESMGIEDNEKNRRDYRNIFFTTLELEKYVNGVILFDETSKQKADNGKNFVEFLTTKGIIPGIKVDMGLVNFTNSEEKYTKGLEGLKSRLKNYYEAGLRFAKWRAAFEVSENTPSEMAINKNCEILAEYAKDCQEEKIVPIVEPEVVYDGNYSIEKSAEITGKILDKLFEEMRAVDVDFEGCILKVNMVLAGKKFATQSTPEEVGRATAEVLRAHVPKDLAGVVFLSGGQTVEQATENLQAVTNNGPFPWPVTFSFARALQDPALEAWRGDNRNADLARQGFHERLVANCNALKKN